MIKKFLKYRKFIKKIQKELPKFSPTTGIRLDWAVHVKTKRKFNTQTGESKQIGMAWLEINQCPPRSLRDSKIYEFDWKKRDFKNTGRILQLRWA